MANRYDSSRQWYAVHTYSGYEEKVGESIRQRINAVDMADKMLEDIDFASLSVEDASLYRLLSARVDEEQGREQDAIASVQACSTRSMSSSSWTAAIGSGP